MDPQDYTAPIPMSALPCTIKYLTATTVTLESYLPTTLPTYSQITHQHPILTDYIYLRYLGNTDSLKDSFINGTLTIVSDGS